MTAQQILTRLLEKFLGQNAAVALDLELEVKFKEVSNKQYDNVATKLLNYGFTCKIKEGTDILRLFFGGGQGSDEVRAEIEGLEAISTYCKTGVLPANTKFIKKTRLPKQEQRAEFTDFNFNVDLKQETTEQPAPLLLKYKTAVPNLLRYLKRFTFDRADMPLQVDMSIVKTANSAAKIFSAEAHLNYEIEAEFIYDKCKQLNLSTAEAVLPPYRSLIKYILTGLQDSNFPISKKEINNVLADYSVLAFGKQEALKQEGYKNFIGPNSVALERSNIVSLKENYTVTDKADGTRKLLYIAPGTGKVYFITKELDVQYTGISITQTELFNTLLDGEHITKDKEGRAVNLYAAFDAYYAEGKPVYFREFFNAQKPDEETRYGILTHICDFLVKMFPLGSLTILAKQFFANDKTGDIFAKSKQILENADQRGYATDGLIFTPAKSGVSNARNDGKPLPGNHRWSESFKWKQAEENSVDFLIEITEKDQGLVALYVYKDRKNTLFKPDAYDESAEASSKATIPGLLVEGLHVRSGDIVEFAYDTAAQTWKALRLRSDKDKPNGNEVAQQTWRTIHVPVTENMITSGEVDDKAMMEEDNDYNDDEYYEGTKVSTNSKNLSKFHNKIKSLLLESVALYQEKTGKPPVSLIDLSAGRGGDLYKWHFYNIEYVLGIDKSSTNLVEAKKRYTEMKKKPYGKFFCDFVQGDTSLNLRTGQAAKKPEDNALIVKITTKEYPAGFNITSMQFALHYMFKDVQTLNGFLQNVAENTAMNGYFIGTCYDGRRVFELLQAAGGELKGPAFQILRRYDASRTAFPADETSVGFQIDVNQESIGTKLIPEWLVNFEYLTQKMREYSFAPLTTDELQAIKWPVGTDYNNGYGSFQSLNKIIYLTKFSPNKFLLTEKEQQVSFLNNYFIYKKVSTQTLPSIAQSAMPHMISTAQSAMQSTAQSAMQSTAQSAMQSTAQSAMPRFEQPPTPAVDQVTQKYKKVKLVV